MILINLLPYELRPVKRTPIPYILSVLVLLIALGSMASLYLNNRSEIGQMRAQVAQHEQQLAALEDIVKESNQLNELKGQLAKKIETIQEIVSDRIIWSKQLWNLSRIAPENFWYSEIGVEVKRTSEQVTEYDPQTKEYVTRPQQVSKPMLTVSGYVIEGPDGSNHVSPLMRAAEQDEQFSELFQLESPQFGYTMLDGYPVNQFTLEFVIKQGGTAQ